MQPRQRDARFFEPDNVHARRHSATDRIVNVGIPLFGFGNQPGNAAKFAGERAVRSCI